MTQQKPKVYTAEFRESSVKLAIESDKPVAQTAREIGVNENTLHTWISQYSWPVDNIKAVRTDEHLYEELKRLKKEVARLTEERDLLKKAAAYFAKEQRWSTPGSNSIKVNSPCYRCAGFYRSHRVLTMIDCLEFLHSGNEKTSNLAVL